MYVGVCLQACLHTTRMPVFLGNQKRALDSPGPEVTDGYKPWCGCWKLNPGPLEKQWVILTPEPSLQFPTSRFLCGCWGSQLGSSCLPVKLYTKWAIFLVYSKKLKKKKLKVLFWTWVQLLSTKAHGHAYVPWTTGSGYRWFPQFAGCPPRRTPGSVRGPVLRI